MKTRILVTGANGQLGQTINEKYSNDPSFDIKFVSKSDLDITNKEALNSFFDKNIFDYCVNCAAYTNVEQAEESIDLAFKVNAEAVKNISIICKAKNIILLHISTDYVFDGNKITPYIEEDETNPINEYGKSKLSGEKYIQEIKPKYFIIRTGWLYSEYGNNFLKSIIGKIQKQEHLSITTSQKGTPTSCAELSEFIIRLVKSKNSNFGIYHFSAFGETSWYDYALHICKHFSNYDCLKIKPVDKFISKAVRPKYSVLDNKKALTIVKEQKLWKTSVDNTVLNLIKASSIK